MKKFTTIASALLLGSLGFSAMADTAEGFLANPTVTPKDGTVIYGQIPDTHIAWTDTDLEAAQNNMKVSISYNGGDPEEIAAYLEYDGYMGEGDKFVITGSYISIKWDSEAVDADTKLLVPGDYTITVPEGLVKNGKGDVNDKMIINYQVYATVGEDEILPDPNAWNTDWTARLSYSSAQLSNVTIDFGQELQAIPNPPAIALTGVASDDEGGEFDPAPFSIENGVLDAEYVKVEGNAIILDLSFLPDGEWGIEIPAGYALIKDVDGTYTSSVEFSYVVENALTDPKLLAAQNYALYTTSTIPEFAVLTWNYQPIELVGDDVTITIEDSYSYESNTVTVKASDIEVLYVIPETDNQEPGIEPAPEGDLAVYADEEEAPNALQINLLPYLEGIDSKSVIMVTIPAGLVSNGELVNAEYSFQFDIMPLYDGLATFLLDEDGIVNISWGEDFVVSVNAAWDDTVTPAYITNSEGENRDLFYEAPFAEEMGLDKPEITENEDFNGLVVFLNDLKLEAGDYTLTIPTGYVSLDTYDYSGSWVNISTSWAFTVDEEGNITEDSSAVSAILNGNAVEGVYNLQGVKMSNDLNTLAPDLYIINGKKVLIRK